MSDYLSEQGIGEIPSMDAITLPENWNESPYREGDLLIAGRDCIYPGSRMDGWCYFHDGIYYKPLTPDAKKGLKLRGYERVHVTGENGKHLMLSNPADVVINGVVFGLTFVQGRGEMGQVIAKDPVSGYSLSVDSGRRALSAWYLVSRQHGGTARVGHGVSPPSAVKALYGALPEKLVPLPPDSLCYICGNDTGGKCNACGRLICRNHTAWYDDHAYDCWECAEKYCAECWESGEEARAKAEALRGDADRVEQAWREKCRVVRS